MAIAVSGGHVSRALDFYNKEGKYFIIGGTTAWTDESDPDDPSVSDFKLKDVIGLKRVDNTHLVIPAASGTISYRDQNWKIVPESIRTTISVENVSTNATSFSVTSIAGLVIGSKVRINNLYEGTITNISGLVVTLDTAAPADIAIGSPVIGGALVEGAKYVYVDCYLNYDEFPIQTYRQIGLCTGVSPNVSDILLSSAYAVGGNNEYSSLGVLEILDNRLPAHRDINQRELLSLIIEF